MREWASLHSSLEELHRDVCQREQEEKQAQDLLEGLKSQYRARLAARTESVGQLDAQIKDLQNCILETKLNISVSKKVAGKMGGETMAGSVTVVQDAVSKRKDPRRK